MQVTAETPSKSITIAGLEFTVPAPYSEGHVLTSNESDVLNQTLAENLRNNFAASVKKAKEAAGEGPVDVASLQSELDKYVATYEFGVRRTGTGSAGPKMEPRERIAHNLAKAKIKEQLTKLGKKVSDFDPESINKLASDLIEKDAQFYKEADRQLKTQRQIAEAEIDLGELQLKPVEEANAEGEQGQAA